jgi:predicted RNA binding protein YcfA (HicA-like mRNA interferase family)
MPNRPGSSELLKVLQQHGFYAYSQKGSHLKLKSAEGRVVIGPHPKKEIPIGTVRSIIRQSGLPPSVFGF